MNKRVGLVLTSSLAASLVTLAGCGGGGGGNPAQQQSSSGVDFSKAATGTLTTGGFSPTDEVGTSRRDYAATQLKDVKITIQQGNFDPQKFAAQAAAGQVPDVVQMDRSFVATYAAKNLIMPLDKCFSDLGVNPSAHYYQTAMTDVTYQGKPYAVPQFYQPPVVLLNQRVMKKAGVTKAQLDTSKPDQLLEAVKKMYKESKGLPSTLGLDPRNGLISTWMLGYGGRLMDADGRPTLDDPNNIKAFQYLKKLYDAQGGYADVTSFVNSFDAFGDQNPFVRDQVGAELIEQWYVNVLTETASKIELGAVPFKDMNGQPLAVAGGTGFAVPTKSKNPAAACQWAVALTSDAAWKKAAEARVATNAKTPGALFTGLFTGSVTADKMIKETYVKPTGNKGFDEAIAATYQVVSRGKSIGASPAGLQIQTELTNAGAAAMTGPKTPEQALKEAQAAALRAYEAVGK
ncbi:MAG TPA: extracellular solute-binding protein [Propionibacteriaceae bacterium]|nr:extracellular solute-binding protein [Propionibacteriaceae bacterium]